MIEFHLIVVKAYERYENIKADCKDSFLWTNAVLQESIAEMIADDVTELSTLNHDRTSIYQDTMQEFKEEDFASQSVVRLPKDQ
jgi:hypothetical protein